MPVTTQPVPEIVGNLDHGMLLRHLGDRSVEPGFHTRPRPSRTAAPTSHTTMGSAFAEVFAGAPPTRRPGAIHLGEEVVSW